MEFLKCKFRVLPLLVLVSACSNYSPTAREVGALSGTAIGAGLGAIVGNQVGSSGAGVAIGSAFGAISGGLVGDAVAKGDEAIAERDAKLRDYDERLRANAQLIAELKARGADVYENSRGTVINLPEVFFAFNSDELSDSAYQAIEKVSELVNQEVKRRITIEGHTDSVGTYQYNEQLSYRRARGVASALEREGVSRSRMVIKGLGESKPVASNSSAEGRRANRRVEVILLK
jgi:outer membrane protein OmpA-like peptidoglycan-associated protein